MSEEEDVRNEESSEGKGKSRQRGRSLVCASDLQAAVL